MWTELGLKWILLQAFDVKCMTLNTYRYVFLYIKISLSPKSSFPKPLFLMKTKGNKKCGPHLLLRYYQLLWSLYNSTISIYFL